MDYLNSIIHDNWKHMKDTLQDQWDKLTEDDIKEINGEYQKLKDKLQKLYHYKTAKVEKELLQFIYSHNLDELGSKTINKVKDMKDSVLSALENNFGTAKQKSLDIEKSIIDCASKNPFKFAGIAAVIGLGIGLIFKK